MKPSDFDAGRFRSLTEPLIDELGKRLYDDPRERELNVFSELVSFTEISENFKTVPNALRLRAERIIGEAREILEEGKKGCER